jgi:secreted PhoX family phosphatase
MRTKDDRRGNVVFGTLGNCAMGHTPWGSYLTCEEHFDSYFNGLEKPSADQKRYGIREKGAGLRWHEHDSRFDVATDPNESNRFGWVVEIDPMAPTKAPVKRTALGRIKHEGAVTTLAGDGRVVVYMGDDERFEYLYKFVSRNRFDSGKPAANANLLDEGTLYVARFGEDGQGQWQALEHGQNGLTADNGFIDQADVLIRTRQAADQAGATRMDRPEGIAVHPQSGEVYCSLTNNSQRGVGTAPGVDAANPRRENRFGHILRWREQGGDAGSQRFAWDIFARCGDPQQADENKRGNLKGDAFACPDRLVPLGDFGQELDGPCPGVRIRGLDGSVLDPAYGDDPSVLVGEEDVVAREHIFDEPLRIAKLNSIDACAVSGAGGRRGSEVRVLLPGRAEGGLRGEPHSAMPP